MANGVFEFFRNHIKMAMYGTRCEIYQHLEIPVAGEVSKDDAPIQESLFKIDAAVNTCLNAIDKIVAPESELVSVSDLDEFRGKLEEATFECRKTIDEIMCAEPMRKRLFDIAMKKQQEMQRQQNIQKVKDAINPANLAGAPREMNGAETVKIEKKEDGTAEVKPVEESAGSADK